SGGPPAVTASWPSWASRPRCSSRRGARVPPGWPSRRSGRSTAPPPWSSGSMPANAGQKCRAGSAGMSRTRARLRPRREHGHNGPYLTEENTMAKYLLLKHYRGAPTPVNDVPMDQWTPEEISAHVQFMQDWAARLEGTGEFVDGQALSP